MDLISDFSVRNIVSLQVFCVIDDLLNQLSGVFVLQNVDLCIDTVLLGVVLHLAVEISISLGIYRSSYLIRNIFILRILTQGNTLIPVVSTSK